MNKKIKLIVSILLIVVFACPCVFLCEKASAETTSGKIHSLIPKVEQFYPDIESYIADCVRERQTKIDVKFFGITTDNIPKVFKSAVFTNPDIFYVDASYIRYQYDSEGIVHYIIPDYILPVNKIPTYVKRFNKAVNKFLSDIDTTQSNFRKALLIHDKLIKDCEYKSGGDIVYTSYGAIVNKKAVCEGYTRAYCYLLSKVGIESKTINIEKKEHCWNYVKLSGEWYHVDVTSDDPLPDTSGYVSHKYFLVSDSKLSSYKSDKHTGYKNDVTYSSTYKCSSTKYNSSFFRNIKSEIILKNNSYYYINNNYKGKNYSVFICRKNNKNKNIKLIKDKWYNSSGERFKGSYSRLCYLDGFIYFNTKRELYRYKISSGKVKRLFVMPSFWSDDFYGIKTSGRYIITEKKKSELQKKSLKKILYIRDNQSVFKLLFIRKSSVKIKKKNTYSFVVYGGYGKTVYKSSNSRVARVNSKGIVRALKKGTCTITAKKNSKTFKLKVKVIK